MAIADLSPADLRRHADCLPKRYKFLGDVDQEHGVYAGGTAVVLEVEDTQTGAKPLLVKMLRLDRKPYPEHAESLQREVELLQKLAKSKDPFSVRLAGTAQDVKVGMRHDPCYLVLDPGWGADRRYRSLEHIYHARTGCQGLILPELLAMWRRWGEFLQGLHTQGIDFPDVKMVHVWWDLEGERLRVIDFNRSHIVNGSGPAPEWVQGRDVMRFAKLVMFPTLAGGYAHQAEKKPDGRVEASSLTPSRHIIGDSYRLYDHQFSFQQEEPVHVDADHPFLQEYTPGPVRELVTWALAATDGTGAELQRRVANCVQELGVESDEARRLRWEHLANIAGRGRLEALDEYHDVGELIRGADDVFFKEFRRLKHLRSLP